jgi:2-amino-4-hydroxy-6-hydroxymethyldihydropteridine diphosphokinase
MNRAAVSAGSNIDPFSSIKKAKAILEKELRVVAASEMVVTKPIGFADQDDFVNAVFLVETDLDKSSLAAYLKTVEDRLGRVRTPNKFGPRTIDLDVIVYNNEIVNSDVYERDFLKKLLASVLPEIAPRLR